MKRKIVLASQSPRRVEILKSLGLDFQADPAQNFEELKALGQEPKKLLSYNAEGKAKDRAAVHPKDLILGVDTIGVHKGKILEKPKDEAEAFEMLSTLQGQTHEVLTGICLLDAASGKKKTVIEVSKVTFAPLSEEEIWAYIKTGESMDKAAAYAVQGKGALFIQKIEGDYWNIVGLPIYRLGELLKEFDIHLLSH